MKAALLGVIFFLTGFLQLNGQVCQWGKAYGRSVALYDFGIVADSIGNTYTMFRANDTVHFGGGVPPQKGRYIILKSDSSGNPVWTKSLDSKSYVYSLRPIAIDHTGNILITGKYTDTVDFDPGPGQQIRIANSIGNNFILKLNQAGDFVWVKEFVKANMPGAASAQNLVIRCDMSGNIYVGGKVSGATDFDPGPASYILGSGPGGQRSFIVKLDSSGSFVWASEMLVNGRKYMNDLTIDRFQNVYVTGLESHTGSDADIYLYKLNSAGATVWDHTFSADTAICSGNSLTTDEFGNVYLVGGYARTVDLDPGPNVYLVSTNSYNSGNFIAKYNSMGNFIWANTYAPNSGSFTNEILYQDGVLHLAGTIYDTMDIDPGPTTYILSPWGNGDNYILRLDSTGNFISATTYGSSTFDYYPALAIDGSGNEFVMGTFSDSIRFQDGISSINSVGNSSIYIAKFSDALISSTKTATEREPTVIILFPNPANDVLNFSISGKTIVDITIHNSLGQVVSKSSNIDLSSSYDILNLREGLYFVTLGRGSEIYTEKLIIRR